MLTLEIAGILSGILNSPLITGGQGINNPEKNNF
jgi:hypothetical protein